ncbi:hypothetical protein R5W24_000666 [Gemmata sp. JC717]|uniref:Uncharacterized protein n=1 Tax=Gemmata algarum TaxID=2975278 RepID=A0ABU5F3N2_9BACT|nr:hypothetical protein [Gemmata algarum]MDY3551588.1 hypothetical protein [Gemmata algarum]MDY3560474.1 hypothetical protein [Gemmata algarum]
MPRRQTKTETISRIANQGEQHTKMLGRGHCLDRAGPRSVLTRGVVHAICDALEERKLMAHINVVRCKLFAPA